MSIDDKELGELYPTHVEAVKARHDRALEKAGAGHAVVFSGAPRRCQTSEREAWASPDTRSKPGTAADALAISAIAKTNTRIPVPLMHNSGPLWKTTNDAKIARGLKLYVSPNRPGTGESGGLAENGLSGYHADP